MSRLSRMKQFLVDVMAELKKTTWPGKQEVYGTTMVVIVTVLICAFFLWVVDKVLDTTMAKLFEMVG